MANTEPRYGRTSSCPLEELNMGCLVAILSASNSLTDLDAFIRASPAVLNSFLLAKASILCDVLTKELGPAIRDILIMSLTDDIDMLAAGTLEQTLDTAVGAYRQALQGDKAPWVSKNLDIDILVGMARLTRVAVYFVDLYIITRIQYFKDDLDPSCGTWSASQRERYRIAQALIRYQIIISLHHPGFYAEKGVYFFTNMLRLFSAWELEQVSEINAFVCGISDAFLRQYNTSHRCINAYHYDGYDGETPRLPAFYTKLLEAQNSDDELLAKVMLVPERSLRWKGKMKGNGVPHIRWLRASHRWARWRSPPYLTAALELAEGPGVRISFNGDLATDTPWAWVHAWNGKRVTRWGQDLVPERASDDDWEDHKRVKDLVYSWRWMGLMFWDKDRTEALLTAKVLEGCSTGWLASYFEKAGNDES